MGNQALCIVNWRSAWHRRKARMAEKYKQNEHTRVAHQQRMPSVSAKKKQQLEERETIAFFALLVVQHFRSGIELWNVMAVSIVLGVCEWEYIQSQERERRA